MGAIIVIGVMVVIVSVAMTTRESRAEARRKFARWNPLFIAILIAELAVIFWPWGSSGR
jgi:NADH:ubiquinone oxidoreductase subunit 6 (subunit J)